MSRIGCVLLFLFAVSHGWEIVKKVQEGKKTVKHDGVKTSITCKKVFVSLLDNGYTFRKKKTLGKREQLSRTICMHGVWQNGCFFECLLFSARFGLWCRGAWRVSSTNPPYSWRGQIIYKGRLGSSNANVLIYHWKGSFKLICSWGNKIFIFDSPRPMDGCPLLKHYVWSKRKTFSRSSCSISVSSMDDVLTSTKNNSHKRKLDQFQHFWTKHSKQKKESCSRLSCLWGKLFSKLVEKKVQLQKILPQNFCWALRQIILTCTCIYSFVFYRK